MSNYDEGNWTAPPPSRACKHGGLLYSCRICDMEQRVEHQAKRDECESALRERIKELEAEVVVVDERNCELRTERDELAAQCQVLRDALDKVADCPTWATGILSADRVRKALALPNHAEQILNEVKARKEKSC